MSVHACVCLDGVRECVCARALSAYVIVCARVCILVTIGARVQE